MAENSSPRNYYADLGLSPHATPAEIRAAWLRLAKEHHPDKKGDNDATEFRKIQEAYEKLRNVEPRPFNVFNPRKSSSTPNSSNPHNSSSTSGSSNPRNSSSNSNFSNTRNSSSTSNPFNPRNSSSNSNPFSLRNSSRTSNFFPFAKLHDTGTEMEEQDFVKSPPTRHSPSKLPMQNPVWAHGVRIRMLDHPAGGSSAKLCNPKASRWDNQTGPELCIFCMELIQNFHQCPTCEAIACADCLEKVKAVEIRRQTPPACGPRFS